MTEQYTATEPDSAGGEGLEVQLAQELVDRARNEGVSLVGPDGLLAGVTRTVLQTALNAEMTQHLGYEKGDSASQGAGNHRNGTSPKTVRTEVGPVRRCSTWSFAAHSATGRTSPDAPTGGMQP